MSGRSSALVLFLFYFFFLYMYGNIIVAIYLKQKVIPRKTWSVSVTTLVLSFFHHLYSGPLRPSGLPEQSSNNFAPSSASGVCGNGLMLAECLSLIIY